MQIRFLPKKTRDPELDWKSSGRVYREISYQRVLYSTLPTDKDHFSTADHRATTNLRIPIYVAYSVVVQYKTMIRELSLYRLPVSDITIIIAAWPDKGVHLCAVPSDMYRRLVSSSTSFDMSAGAFGK